MQMFPLFFGSMRVLRRKRMRGWENVSGSTLPNQIHISSGAFLEFSVEPN